MLTRRLAMRRQQAAKLLRLLPVPLFRKGLRLGAAAAVEHLALLRWLGPQTVLDVGANVGQFALAVRAAVPSARIIAFEPLAGPAATFRRVFADDPAVRLLETALGATAGEAVIHVSRREDSSSLLPIGEGQRTLFPGTDEARTETIRVAPLDDLVAAADLAPPTLMKIDVQGFELPVLEGCATLLDRFAWVYVEASFVPLYEGQALAHEVIAWLAARGCVLRGVHNPTWVAGRCIQADLLFGR